MKFETGEGGRQGRKGRRNSILSCLAEDSADLDPRQGLLSGPPREPRQGSLTCEGGHQDGQDHQGHLGHQGDQGGPRLLVEHVSQLSEPDCRFCQHPAPHLDCSKINIYSGGNPCVLAHCVRALHQSEKVFGISHSLIIILPNLPDIAPGTVFLDTIPNISRHTS